MILFTFAEEHETEPAWSGASLRSWRWVFVVKWKCFGFTREYKMSPGDSWGGEAGYYHALLSGAFRLGYKSYYYDGEHRQFSLGWLHLCWGF